MARSKNETPSFDFEDIAPPTRQQQEAADVSDSLTWREVPAARFLSWPAAMQAAYCRDRDLDSAEHAENEGWTQFYLHRANTYDEASKRI